MIKWTSKSSTATLAAALVMGASAFVAAPAAAAPPDNASCTARTVSNGAQNAPGPFGGIVHQYATYYGDEWGESISKEARTKGACPKPLPFPPAE